MVVTLLLMALLVVERKPSGGSVRVQVETEPQFPVRGGPVAPLRPGLSSPLALSFENMSERDMVITGLTVTIIEVRAPRSTPDRPCSAADYRAHTGDVVPLRLPVGTTVSLTKVGLPRTSWPRLEMLDTDTNQDGCKGAEVLLDYRTALEAA